eukprot:CAMPEP_0197002292 /NCGR_PEP_ID=MMETSP1380-20130617/6806_1 /TAXON_ID=5936 /ORGANISM="Euplotes crassus, Strain CT5" /LENGTH=138 /DNA_ID=CAMNT_0042420355 /DNA_START=48 /DNA_END=464 /DNA_ORIENTATION=-
MKIESLKQPIGLVEREDPLAETKEHRRWRSEVLKEHKETSRVVDDAIIGLKKTSESTKDLLTSTKSVSEIWSSFEDKLKVACKNLGDRIEADLAEKEAMRKRIEEYLKKNSHHKVETTSSISKKQEKYVPKERKLMKF